MRKTCLRNFYVPLLFISTFSFGQMTVTGGGYTATQLATHLQGPGVTVFNATLTCPSNAYGEYVVSGTPGMDSGIVLTTGSVSDYAGGFGVSGSASIFASTDNAAPGDAELSSLTTEPTFDACILEFDLQAVGDSIQFKYRFGSEEYTDYTCSPFNDVFGFFITGGAYTTPTNIALVTGTSIPVCINSVNCGATGSYPFSTCTALGAGSPFCAYYVNNLADTVITYDGLTTVFTAMAAVNPVDTYHLKLAVADVSDGVFDSGVFLESPSLISAYRPATQIPSGNSSDQLDIAPNPVKDMLVCRSRSLKKGTLTITDINGKMVLSEQVNFDDGETHIPLRLVAGIYSVKFSGNNEVIRKTIVVAN